MVTLVNQIKMVEHQSKSSFLNELERKQLIKSRINKLETLAQQVQFEIARANNELKYNKSFELEDAI